MKVLVVGGGIGGLSAAIGLTQRGVDVEVAELNKEWTVYHVGIIVQANFVRALAMLGLGDAAVQAGFPYKGLRFLDADGSMLAELPGDPTVAAPYPADLGLTRPALHKVLTEAMTRLEVPIRLGVTYSNIDDQGDKVVVDFTDGTRGTYDLVIGADGAYSKMRKLVCADAPTPEYTGQGVWRYNVPRPKDQDWLDLYIKGDRTTAGYCPLTEDTMYIMAVTEEPGNPRFPRETLAEEFRKRLEGFGGKLGKLREQVTDSNLVVYRPLEVCACPAPWHKGRIVLVGDAAHSTTPHLGQGAAMAVEDAVVLVDELASKQNTLDDALKRYMERRYERAMMIHDNSIMLGDWQMHPEKADRSQAEVTEYIRARIAEPL
jgi:2-polyprenyl-6-methoxyphenol hydroxylase-like FAD-dependent oxidoreductase